MRAEPGDASINAFPSLRWRRTLMSQPLYFVPWGIRPVKALRQDIRTQGIRPTWRSITRAPSCLIAGRSQAIRLCSAPFFTALVVCPAFDPSDGAQRDPRVLSIIFNPPGPLHGRHHERFRTFVQYCCVFLFCRMLGAVLCGGMPFAHGASAAGTTERHPVARNDLPGKWRVSAGFNHGVRWPSARNGQPPARSHQANQR